MAMNDDIFSIRDIIDSQLETRDHIRIGRVSDIEAEWRDDHTPVLTALVVGPEALAGRIASPLRTLLGLLFRGRFDHRISIQDVEEFGPTLRLHGAAADYPVGQSDRWIAKYILRWIPGSGYCCSRLGHPFASLIS